MCVYGINLEEEIKSLTIFILVSSQWQTVQMRDQENKAFSCLV